MTELSIAFSQVERGKAILEAFDTKVTLHPCGDHLEAVISGKTVGLFLLEAAKGQKVQQRWLGEEDSNPRQLIHLFRQNPWKTRVPAMAPPDAGSLAVE